MCNVLFLSGGENVYNRYETAASIPTKFCSTTKISKCTTRGLRAGVEVCMLSTMSLLLFWWAIKFSGASRLIIENPWVVDMRRVRGALRCVTKLLLLYWIVDDEKASRSAELVEVF